MQTFLHACTMYKIPTNDTNLLSTQMVGIRKIGLSHCTKQEFSCLKQGVRDSGMYYRGEND